MSLIHVNILQSQYFFISLSFQILINNSLLNADSALLHTNIADEQVGY